jgi:hypothetical protein
MAYGFEDGLFRRVGSHGSKAGRLPAATHVSACNYERKAVLKQPQSRRFARPNITVPREASGLRAVHRRLLPPAAPAILKTQTGLDRNLPTA